MRRSVLAAVVIGVLLASVWPRVAVAGTQTLSSIQSAEYWVSRREFASQPGIGAEIEAVADDNPHVIVEKTLQFDPSLMSRASYAVAMINGSVRVSRVVGCRAFADYYVEEYRSGSWTWNNVGSYSAWWHRGSNPRDSEYWGTAVEVTGARAMKLGLEAIATWDDWGPIVGWARAEGYIDKVIYYEPVGKTEQDDPLGIYSDYRYALYRFPVYSSGGRVVRAVLRLNVVWLDPDDRTTRLTVWKASGWWGSSGECDVLSFSGGSSVWVSAPGEVAVDVTYLWESGGTLALTTPGHASLSRVARLDLLVDLGPPQISATPSGYVGREGVSVAITVTDDNGVTSQEYAWANSTSPPSTWSPLVGSMVSQDAEGVWYLHVRATDIAGNRAVSCFGPYRVDRTPPVVGFSPSTCAWRSGPVAVSVSVSDPVSAVSSVQYAWARDGAPPGVWASLSGSSVTQSAEGVWYLWVRACDAAGNSQDVKSGPYRIDLTAPVIAAAPAESDWVNRPVEVRVSFADLSGIASSRWSLSQSRLEPGSWSVLADGRVCVDEEGVWYLHVEAVDLVGNVARSCFGPYRLDMTLPEVAVSPELSLAPSRLVTVDVAAQDALSGVASREYAWSPSPSSSVAWARVEGGRVVQVVPGMWYLHVRVADRAGNVTQKVAGPYRVVSPEVLPGQPVPPSGDDLPDWWTPPWRQGGW